MIVKIKTKLNNTLNVKSNVKVVAAEVVNGNYEEYDGSYEFTPTEEKQVASTKNKIMKEDVTFNGVKFYEVSNETDGKTIYIGE